jgi:hypothetical protein
LPFTHFAFASLKFVSQTTTSFFPTSFFSFWKFLGYGWEGQKLEKGFETLRTRPWLVKFRTWHWLNFIKLVCVSIANDVWRNDLKPWT